MNALILTDGEYKTEEYDELIKLTKKLLEGKNYKSRILEIDRGLRSCKGCFGCWIKKPGECVINDEMLKIYQSYMNSDAVIFICPVVFGQFSANIKNVVDRTLPDMLPFFCRRTDGSTMHPARYEKYPQLFLIGYGHELDQEEARLFLDITEKHRNNVFINIYQGKEDIEKIKTLFNMINNNIVVRREREV